MSPLHVEHLAFATQPVVPWKNGKGTTRQIAIEPRAATVAGPFNWRISRAAVGSDGPFSSFPGIDRSLWLLGGAGIELAFAGRRVRLDRRLARCDFRGEDAIDGRLLAGPIEDLNVMVARDRATANCEVRPLRAGAERRLLLPAGTTVIVALDSPLVIGDRELASGDALRLDATAPDDLLLRTATAAALLVATFVSRLQAAPSSSSAPTSS